MAVHYRDWWAHGEARIRDRHVTFNYRKKAAELAAFLLFSKCRRGFLLRGVRDLGKMGPDCIDHRGLLTDEQMARAVQHQTALLLGGLGWHEPHVGPGDRLANGLCVSRII